MFSNVELISTDIMPNDYSHKLGYFSKYAVLFHIINSEDREFVVK